MNDVTNKIAACYWCGTNTELKSNPAGSFWIKCRSEDYCWATGPKRGSQEEAIAAWNSLAPRIKPEPKKVTMKRWVNVYDVLPNDESSRFGSAYETKELAIKCKDSVLDLIDTVEVEITFTDRRGCE